MSSKRACAIWPLTTPSSQTDCCTGHTNRKPDPPMAMHINGTRKRDRGSLLTEFTPMQRARGDVPRCLASHHERANHNSGKPVVGSERCRAQRPEQGRGAFTTPEHSRLPRQVRGIYKRLMARKPLNVMITVDTEIWPRCHDWRERRLQGDIARDILGQTPNGRYGIGYQAQLLAQHGLKAVFFVEALFACEVG